MSIEQFGESLLSDIRKRREQESRRLRKQEERNALLGLGIGLAAKIGNERLAAKTNDFLTKEPIWNANLAQKQARTYTADLFNTETQMAAQGGELDWTLKNMGPQFEEYLQRNLPDDITGKAGPYEEWREKQKLKMAEDWLENQYRPALALAKKVASEEDYSAMVELNTKKAAPSNLGSWITRTGANLIGGKNQKDVETEAVIAITEGRMAENAEKLNTFMSTYRRTGDIVRSFDIANVVFPEVEMSADEKFKINRTQKLQEIDDRLVVYEEVEKTEINTGEKTTEINVTDEGKPRVIFKPNSDNNTVSLDTMKGLNTIFNFEKDGRQLLRPEAFANFADEATNEQLNIQAPKTVAEHNKLQAIYRKYLNNSDNLRDEYRNQKTLRTFELVVGEPEELQAMLSSVLVETDPQKRNAAMQELQTFIASKLSFAEELQSATTFDYNTTFRNP